MPHLTTQDSPFLGLTLLSESSPPIAIRPNLHFSHMGPPLPKNVCYFPLTLHRRLPSIPLPHSSPTIFKVTLFFITSLYSLTFPFSPFFRLENYLPQLASVKDIILSVDPQKTWV